jgi:hypothetical protein
MRRREQLFIQQHSKQNLQIHSTSAVSPSAASAATVPSLGDVSSLSRVSQQLSVTPVESSRSNPGYASAELPPVSRLSVDSNVASEPGQELDTSTHLSVPLKLPAHSTTYSQLPLDMTKPQFEIRVTTDQQSDVEISVTRTESFQL